MYRRCYLIAIRTSLFLIVIVGYTAIDAFSQKNPEDAASASSAAPDISFEVASIKRSTASQHEINGVYTYPGGRLVTHGATVRYLISVAYNIDESQIVGWPAWVDEDRFDIIALAPEILTSHYANLQSPTNTIPRENRQMLKNLLVERFQLSAHTEEMKGQIYELTRNNRPLRLNPPKNAKAYPYAGSKGGGVPDGRGLHGENISMPELAKYATIWLGCCVVDRTGLSGSYDFRVNSDSLDDIELSLLDGVQQSLREIGLTLKKTTGTVSKLAVDHVSQPSRD